MSLTTARRKDLGLGATAAGGTTGSWASYHRTHPEPPAAHHVFRSREAELAAEILQGGFTNVTVVEGETGELSRIRLSTDLREVDLSDVLEPGRIGYAQQTEAVLARAGYLLDLDRAAQLRMQPASLTPELGRLREQELLALTTRTREFEVESPWAPDVLLLGEEREAVVHDEQGGVRGGWYLAKVIRQSPFASTWDIAQSYTGGTIGELTAGTLHDYRLEIEDWLSGHYEAEVVMLPSQSAFNARRILTRQAGAPTRERVDDVLAGSCLHDEGVAIGSFDHELLHRYLLSHEKIDNHRFIGEREKWIAARESQGDVASRLEAIGPDRMTPEEWAAALWVAPDGGDLQRMKQTAILPENSNATPIGRFLYHGRIDDRSMLTQQLKAIASVDDYSGDLRTVAAALGAKLADRPLIDREPPKMLASRQ